MMQQKRYEIEVLEILYT